MPYLILPLYAVLEKIDPSLLEAACDLGGGRIRTFLSVILPLSLPGIVSGCLFVFIPSMGAFVTPELLGGTRSIMIGSIIAQQFGVAFEYPFGSALALTLMGIIFATAAVCLRYGKPRGQPDAARHRQDRTRHLDRPDSAVPVRAADYRGDLLVQHLDDQPVSAERLHAVLVWQAVQ